MEKARQVIYGTVPSKSNCYRIIKFGNKANLKKSDAVKRYEEAFYAQCNKYRNAGITGFFRLHVDVYHTSMSNDLDNAMKVLLDCLARVGAIKNDNRCMCIHAEKFIDKFNPRIEFTIEPI